MNNRIPNEATRAKMSASAKAHIARVGRDGVLKLAALGCAANVAKGAETRRLAALQPKPPRKRGWKLTVEQRQRLSEMAKKRPYRPISAAHLAALVGGRKGKPISADHRRKIAMALAARSYSPYEWTDAERQLRRQVANALRSWLVRLRTHIGRVSSASENLVRVLGYTREDLRRHLEAQFVDGMAWTNYGTRWEIDHIRPIVHFVRHGIDDPKIVNALHNLQPLWKHDNHAKSGSYRATV